MTDTVLQSIFQHIENHQNDYVSRLKEAVTIPSISSSIDHRKNVFEMADWLAKWMERLHIEVTKRDNGHHLMEGKTVQLPPIVLGRLGRDKKKKTLLVYGHYDVQPASIEDGWSSDPFQLKEDANGRLIARGSTDDKGPVIAWLWAIEAYQALKIDLPVNICFCFEGMEEYGSEGLDDLIKREAKEYFKDVDCVCISDNYWLGKNKPSLTYGLRGNSYFQITIKGPGRDLHSGVFGGTLNEPMIDLAHVISRLVTPQGEILVPGLMDDVLGITEAEKEMYKNLDFNINDFHDSIGAKNTVYSDEMEILMHRWRYPSLSFHGVEGAFSGSGAKTVIPAQVKGKFSIRTVPNQEPDKITPLIVNYIENEFKKLKSKNTIKVECLHAGKSWLADVNHWNFVAGINATKKVWGVAPDMIREGGSIPVTLTFQECLQKNVMLLPIGACDDGAHSINEKLDRKNYIQGIKLLATYFYELSLQ